MTMELAQTWIGTICRMLNGMAVVDAARRIGLRIGCDMRRQQLGGIATLRTCLVMAALLVGLAPMAWAADKVKVAVYCDRQTRMFIYVIGDKEAILWDVDKSDFFSHIPFPRELTDDTSSEEGSFDLTKIVPIRTKNIAVILTFAKRVVFDTTNNVVVSAVPVPSYCWSPCYYDEGGDTLIVLQEVDRDGRPSVVALDAVSGEERHHWGFPARKEISELIQAPYYFTRFHVKGFMGVLGAVDDGTVMMWDLTTNKKMWDAALRYSGIMLRFSPNGDYVLLKDDTVPEIRRTLNGKVVSRFAEKTYGGVSEGEFSPCGKFVLLQSDEMMKEKAILWEWKTNRVKQTYAMPVAIKDGNYHVQFSSDGRRVAVATADFCVYEFETMTGKLIRRELVLKDGDTSEFDVECLFQ